MEKRSGLRKPTIRPVHTRVPGRIRLKIDRLYRSQRVKEQLESGLRGIAGIRSVKANVLTGNLLVIYGPEKSSEEIGRLVAKQLTTAPPSSTP